MASNLTLDYLSEEQIRVSYATILYKIYVCIIVYLIILNYIYGEEQTLLGKFNIGQICIFIFSSGELYKVVVGTTFFYQTLLLHSRALRKIRKGTTLESMSMAKWLCAILV